ncbi:MAG: ATP-dependent sacrificial sulfur transferase LarE [Coriobacteriia bacterium]|nr:ATP-dependent sacrificial sulfur transferase LarE [Coriobacteriia bacterium]
MDQRCPGFAQEYTEAMITAEQKEKERCLRAYLCAAERVVVAFSGGVDSTYLLKVAHDELSTNALAVTSVSCLVPANEHDDARKFCDQEGIELVVRETAPLEVPGFAGNSPERCYLCKTSLLVEFKELARARGISLVLDGSNIDDLGDFRPGLRAVHEQGVESPLIECGFTKVDIRACARELGLKAWDKPSAACLASRIASGEEITPERLARIDAAEQYLHGLGIRQVRVRLLRGGLPGDELARIEADEEGRTLLLSSPGSLALAIAYLLKLGFAAVEPEVALYHSGSMNPASAL